MRKRRVGVTARSRQNVGNLATGSPQFVTEMAAPLAIENPSRHLRQKLQKECGWKHGDTGAGNPGQNAIGQQRGAARARQACHPLREHDVATRPPVKAPLTARWRSALTGPGPRSRGDSTGKREWQALLQRLFACPRLPLVGDKENL